MRHPIRPHVRNRDGAAPGGQLGPLVGPLVDGAVAMTSESARATLPAPNPGLIARLNARTSLGQTEAGRTFASLMLTYPAPQFGEVDPSKVEFAMRGVASTLGAVPAVLPSVVPGRAPSFSVDRMSITPTGIPLIHFDGTPWSMRIAESPAWSRVVAGLGRVLLVVGLDELSSVASAAEVDEYIEYAGEADRLFATVSSVADSTNGRTALRRP
ncbi:hypothetical protein ACIQUY_29160 [Streptomyces sp. NPDC090231]|uniref:hypothetical protein n=1 Tax=unclassified Streptomyces TaxID=2593676 RepID=UPI00381E6CED